MKVKTPAFYFYHTYILFNQVKHWATLIYTAKHYAKPNPLVILPNHLKTTPPNRIIAQNPRKPKIRRDLSSILLLLLYFLNKRTLCGACLHTLFFKIELIRFFSERLIIVHHHQHLARTTLPYKFAAPNTNQQAFCMSSIQCMNACTGVQFHAKRRRGAVFCTVPRTVCAHMVSVGWAYLSAAFYLALCLF